MMREEIHSWMELAESDLEVAQILHNAEKFAGAVYHCQQALEKALKALYITEVGAMFPRTHSLAEIAEPTSFPKDKVDFLRDLTAKYIDTRYPSFPTEKISDIYDEEYSRQVLITTEELVEWIRSQFNGT